MTDRLIKGGFDLKNGICLAGGGVKGAAHIGAIKALEEANLSFEYTGGTSSGSIVASLYACVFTADEMYKIFKKYCRKIKYVDFIDIIKLILGLIFTGKIIIGGLNSGKQIERLINKQCEKKQIDNINEIKKKLVIPSVDLCTGDVICFSSQLYENRAKISDKTIFINDVNIGKAVRASCSYPVVFAPCKYNGRYLVDGGIRENVPWKELNLLGAKKVINFMFEDEPNEECKHDLVNSATKSIGLLCRELSNYEMMGSDFTIKFRSKKVGLLDMNKIDELYSLGYYETKRNIKEIKEFLK